MAQAKICLAFIILALAGCATPSGELRLGQLKPKERIYVGRLKVNFEPKTPNFKCEVYVNRDLVPALKLSSDGTIFYMTDREEVNFTRIACYHQASFYLAAWHHQKLPLKALARPNDQKEAVYFGDILVDWKVDPKVSVTAAEVQPLSTEPTRVGHVYESGELKIQVASDFEYMRQLFLEKVENAREQGFNLQEHLVETL